MTLQWSEDLATGECVIDNHHKNIFRVANDLQVAINEGKGEEFVGKILQFLEYYVTEHFRAEEDFMSKYNYFHGYAAHKADHAQFMKDFNAFKNEFTTKGASSSLALQLQYWLFNWLTIHIGREDKKLGTFMLAKQKHKG